MLRASRVFIALSLLSVAGFAADRVNGVKSSAGTILLRAVLPQSVSVSAEPQVFMFDPFVSSSAERNFPVTFKTRWVHGPASVSFVVLSSHEWDGVENEANDFAAEILVGRKALAAFIAKNPRSAEDVQKFAAKHEIHPGIVVGMLQHHGAIPWSHLNHLKARFDWTQSD